MLDSAACHLVQKMWLPLFAPAQAAEFFHDVAGMYAGCVMVAGKALLAGRAGGEQAGSGTIQLVLLQQVLDFIFLAEA